MPKKLLFYDNSNNIFLKTDLKNLIIKNTYIINKSIELLSEGEPDIFLWSYIRKKLCIELDDFIEKHKDNGHIKEFMWANIPKNIRNAIELEKTPYKVAVIY